MTDDIVQRLRMGNHQNCVDAHTRPRHPRYEPCDRCSERLTAADHRERLRAEVDIKGYRADEAADEIERLRAERDDHKARLCVEAFTAPDADFDTMIDSLQSRIGDMADEIEQLRTALTEIRDLHQPMWESENAKAAGKKPWQCCLCGTADGSWPCDTRLLVDEALEGDDR